MQLSALALLVLSLTPRPALAAPFANQFTQFELPPKWQCNLEGAEWVCQNTDEARKKDAIIVLAAKLKGDQDSLDQYEAYLKKPKIWTSVQGKSLKSDVKSVHSSVINDQPWIDALHMEAEIPGYYTRYLATVKQDIGVLITYSIAKDKYAQYQSDFETMVKTLKVFRKQGGVNQFGPKSGDIFKMPESVTDQVVFPAGTIKGGSEAKPPKQEGPPIIPIALGAAVLLFFIWRRKRQD